METNFANLEREWNSLSIIPISDWTLLDFRLSAELAGMLIECNRQQEMQINQQKRAIEEQQQEINYTNSQISALWEVSKSRLKIYEQLEYNVNDLEKVNRRLIEEINSRKKRERNLTNNIVELEDKCYLLQTKNDELSRELNTTKMKYSTPKKSNLSVHFAPDESDADVNYVTCPSMHVDFTASNSCNSTTLEVERNQSTQTVPEENELEKEIHTLKEHITILNDAFCDLKVQYDRAQISISDLQLEVKTVQDERDNYETQLSAYLPRDGCVKTLFDEFTMLEQKQQSCIPLNGLSEENNIDDENNSPCEELPDKEHAITELHNDVDDVSPSCDEDLDAADPSESRRRTINGHMVRELVEQYELLVSSLTHASK